MSFVCVWVRCAVHREWPIRYTCRNGQRIPSRYSTHPHAHAQAQRQGNQSEECILFAESEPQQGSTDDDHTNEDDWDDNSNDNSNNYGLRYSNVILTSSNNDILVNDDSNNNADNSNNIPSTVTPRIDLSGSVQPHACYRMYLSLLSSPLSSISRLIYLHHPLTKLILFPASPSLLLFFSRLLHLYFVPPSNLEPLCWQHLETSDFHGDIPPSCFGASMCLFFVPSPSSSPLPSFYLPFFFFFPSLSSLHDPSLLVFSLLPLSFFLRRLCCWSFPVCLCR